MGKLAVSLVAALTALAAASCRSSQAEGAVPRTASDAGVVELKAIPPELYDEVFGGEASESPGQPVPSSDVHSRVVAAYMVAFTSPDTFEHYLRQHEGIPCRAEFARCLEHTAAVHTPIVLAKYDECDMLLDARAAEQCREDMSMYSDIVQLTHDVGAVCTGRVQWGHTQSGGGLLVGKAQIDDWDELVQLYAEALGAFVKMAVVCP